MQLRIPCEDYRAVVTGDDQKTIDQQIRARLAEFALEKHEIEDLTLSCVTEIANGVVQYGVSQGITGNVHLYTIGE